MIFLDILHIKEKVIEVYKECDIHSFPINCFSILEHYGIRTITYNETKTQKPELYKAISHYSNDAFRFRMSVYYNSTNSNGRIRFSLMHELGHYILEHTADCPDTEDEADCFASYMLAPRVAIDNNNCCTSDDIHDKFGMSYAAANRTLWDYKKWKEQNPDKSDAELNIWLYYPNYYRHREYHRKNRDRERRKMEKKRKFYEERQKWLEKNLPDYEEYVWNEYDRTFY